MEKTDNNSCHSRVSADRNGKNMEQCKKEARKNTQLLSEEILKKGQVSWNTILETAGHDELVYKLTLNIFDNTDTILGIIKPPRVKVNTNTYISS